MSDRLTPILDACVSRIAALGLAVGGVTLPVLKRKAAVRRESLDPAAMITVAKSATPETVSRWTFASKRTDYKIDVIVHSPYLGPDDDQAPYATFRDTLADVFSRPPLPGADDVFDLRAEPADWLRPTGETTQYDWQSLAVTASVISAN